MRIDFNTHPHTVVPEFKGGLGQLDAQMFLDPSIGKVLTARLEPGCTVGLHRHETDCEVIYILSGKGHANVDGVREELEPGVCTYCPKGSEHELIPDGPDDLVFFAVVANQ